MTKEEKSSQEKHIPWNKGKKMPLSFRRKLSKATKLAWTQGKHKNNPTNSGKPAWNRGKKHSEESIEKMRLAHKGARANSGSFKKGLTPWNRGKRGIVKWTEEQKARLSEIQKTNGVGKWMKGRKLSKERIGKILRRRPMSFLEIKVNDVIEKHGLPYRFVGNGDFFLERKCPDFINTNGEKIAVEVYWDKHKERFRNSGVDMWKKDRLEIFGKYGWKIIFIEGTRLNEQIILSALEGGD